MVVRKGRENGDIKIWRNEGEVGTRLLGKVVEGDIILLEIVVEEDKTL